MTKWDLLPVCKAASILGNQCDLPHQQDLRKNESYNHKEQKKHITKCNTIHEKNQQSRKRGKFLQVEIKSTKTYSYYHIEW